MNYPYSAKSGPSVGVWLSVCTRKYVRVYKEEATLVCVSVYCVTEHRWRGCGTHKSVWARKRVRETSHGVTTGLMATLLCTHLAAFSVELLRASV